MFTGIVLERGRLAADPRPSAEGGVRLRIRHSRALGERLAIGSSVAVAGVCLTVVKKTATIADVELSPETLARTRLGRLKQGASLNLELPLRAGDELGGHIVQGHVDGLVKLRARRDLGDHGRFTFEVPRGGAAWIAEKGSIAIDGVSLTVAALEGDAFEVALVPHTLAVTTLGEARPGDRLHFEADVLAKYVARALGAAGLLGSRD